MQPIIAFLASQSILIPIIIGLVKFKTIRPDYWPFYLDLVLGLFTEIISFILIQKYGASNAIPTNIFVLIEWTLIVYQFRLWGFLKRNDRYYFFIWSVPIFIWIIENLVFGKIIAFSPYFRIFYAFLVTIMSITEINYRIIHQDKNLFRNPRFIICIGFILFFVYEILYEWCYQLSVVEAGTRFTNTIIALFAYTNALTNIIFGIAFMLVPARREFKIE